MTFEKRELDHLVQRIEEEHKAAELSQYASVVHAREAGNLLMEVKEQLLHGQFGSWVGQHCTFAQSTANLYMKIAREWDKLSRITNGVRNLSLLHAGTLLYTGDGDEEKHAQALTELVGCDVLAMQTLEGLSMLQQHVLVREAWVTYEEFVEDPARDKQAMGGRYAPISIDPVALRAVVFETAVKLRDGTLKVEQVKKRIRGFLDEVVRASRKEGKKKTTAATATGDGSPTWHHISPVEAFEIAVEKLIAVLPVLKEQTPHVLYLIHKVRTTIEALEENHGWVRSVPERTLLDELDDPGATPGGEGRPVITLNAGELHKLAAAGVEGDS